MQEHPVPQNVTSFEFKLIGDLTLRQFGYVGGGSAIAILLFFVPQTTFILNALRYLLMFACPASGFALAFLPVEGRPLDRWLVSFIHAIFGNTLYVWRKEGISYDALNSIHSHIVGGTDQAVSLSRLAPATREQPVPLNPLDAEEARVLNGLKAPQGQPISKVLAHPSQIRPSVRRLNPVPQPMPQRPRVVQTFAGPIGPTRLIPSPVRRTTTLPFPSAMRLPHQKPLVPQHIPLPSYQRMSATPVATSLGLQAATSSLHGMPSPHPNIGNIRLVNPLAKTPVPSTLTPTRPMPMAQPTNEVAELKQQNQQLFQRLNELQALVQAKAVEPKTTTTSPIDEAKELTNHMDDLTIMIKQLQDNLASLNKEETNYQNVLRELEKPTTHVAADTDHIEKAKILDTQQSQPVTTNITKAEPQAAKQELDTIHEKLNATKQLSQDLLHQKQLLEDKLHDYVHKLETVGQHQAIAPEPKAQEQEPAAAHTATDTGQLATPGITLPRPTVKPEEPVAPQPQVEPAKFEINFPVLTKIPNAISGYVLDAENKPLMDVVIVVKKKNGPTVRALKSDRVGQFSIVTSLPDGTYEISFEKDGYSFATVTTEAKGDVFPPMKVIGKPAN